MKKNFSGRKILICREMTKYFEEFVRGDIDTIDKLEFQMKGELTIVISEQQNNKKNSQLLSESDKKMISQMMKKLSIKEISNLISRNNKVSKKKIYDYYLTLKNEK
ncbi:hypothetical protein OAT07_01520 [Candidatus Pelagibacter sp.]|nr:hypothetical protein [Candidatus Pelagibacter sp.]